jgi:hypothetical protein
LTGRIWRPDLAFMTGRTSQLQIRVSPEQKAALKRLAAAAGQNVSQYVLARALPRSGDELSGALDELRREGDSRSALETAVRVLSGLGRTDLEMALGSWSAEGMPPLTQNRVAALVEDVTAARGIDPPLWAAAVPPLPRPHFRWTLDSLRPHQLRATRVAWKRRNLFDPHAPSPGTGSAPPGDMARLAEYLSTLELDVEFYFVAGAVLSQVFASRPSSSRPQDVFQPPSEGDPVAEFAARQGRAPDWAADTVRAVVSRRGPPGGFIDVPHLAVFQPPAEYALAMKLAALRPEPSARDLEDLRFLLRALNLTSEDAARVSVSRYVADRHVPPQARERLRGVPSG